MYQGDYGFFDYKYNIIGYTGQDYGGFAQYLYLLISVLLVVSLLIILRKNKNVEIILKVISVFMIFFYLGKTIWESIYDIQLNGHFNYYLLPLDTCSIIMLAGILASFANGKIKEYALSWLCTGGIIGGIATMFFLNAFKYYPFFSFGAFYSMIWHFLMVFLGLLLIITNYVKMNYQTLLKGFGFHLIISFFVIIIDYVFNFDFMMYKDLGGIPFFEGLAGHFNEMNLSFLNPIMMLLLYFIAFNLIYLIVVGCRRILLKK